MRIFIDTSALYALCSGTDMDHEEAVTCFEDIIGDKNVLYTSNYVALETLSLIQRRHGFGVAEEFLEVIQENIEILWIGKEHHLKASELWKEKREKNLSIVDCTSFVLMKEEGLEKVFCFDEHFRREGFTTVP